MSEKAEHAEKGTISLKISNITTYMTKIGQRTESPAQRVAGIEWHGGSGHKPSFRRKLMGKEPFADNWGFKKFVTSEELLSAVTGFVVDDSVEIRLDFSVSNVCGASFNVFETDGALAADVQLRVGDNVFYANKGNHLISRMTCANLKAIKENEGLDQLGVDVLQALLSRHIDMHHV